MPQDWRSLFDTSLFSMDTRLVPQVSKMQLKGGEKESLHSQGMHGQAHQCIRAPLGPTGVH